MTMVPALQRFYGGEPRAWLGMPMGVLELYAEQLPALRAREALHDATVVALGSGRLKDADRVRRAWRREAGLAPRPKRAAAPADTAAYGIGVKRV